MFRQNTSCPKTQSLTCCKRWTWRRDASKFGELILWVACSTKTYCQQESKHSTFSPHCGIQCSIPSKLCPLRKRLPLFCHKNSSQIFDATKIWKHTIALTYNTKSLISNISETHRFSPQMRLIAYPDHKTTLKGVKTFWTQCRPTFARPAEVGAVNLTHFFPSLKCGNGRTTALRIEETVVVEDYELLWRNLIVNMIHKKQSHCYDIQTTQYPLYWHFPQQHRPLLW